MNATIERVALLSVQLPKSNIFRVEVKRISLQPLQKTGYHRHPCSVLGYITQGTITFQIEGEESQTLEEGQAFFEPANKEIVHFDNRSANKKASFIAFYLLEKGEDKLIEML